MSANAEWQLPDRRKTHCRFEMLLCVPGESVALELV